MKFLLIIFMMYPVILFGQVRIGWGGDAAIYGNYSYGTFMGHISITHNWLMSKNFAFSLGVMYSYTRIDELSAWKTSEAHYFFEDDVVNRINILASVTYAQPILKNTGIYVSGSAFAEPIPFSYVSIEKSTNVFDSTSKGKYAYTRFTPGAFIDIGIYHDFRKGNNLLKVFFGIGYGLHDPLPDYRNISIDGQDLSTRIPDKKDLYRVTLRIMGF
ncbi:hypothetical protein [Bacteroides sp. 519]|uniref:hypothetical protein n=1 Tax=Bacteroides sp. 519 TaxID=2302937 RepID=UPI0013D6D6DF|nr:hypothetical protein [Bacteroides sp. 519]NDV57704.1 hypothetical protein [Bacteroides sp. 519]